MLPLLVPNHNHAAETLSSTKRANQTYIEAYRHWKALRDRLSATINDYLGACDAITAICSLPAASPVHQPVLENLLVSVNQELPSLRGEEGKLVIARATLSGLRNRSSSLSPISGLPPEILANIFTLVSLACVRSASNSKIIPSTCPCVLASVSTQWRRVAANTCRLWSHIDLIPASNPNHKLYRRARIWLERLKGAPLHIHIHQRNCAKDEDIAQLISFLAPHMKQLCTLHLSAECHSLDLFEAILSRWLELGRPGSTEALVLERPRPIPLLASLEAQSLQQLHARHPHERLDRFLQPLRTLHLRNVYMGWKTVAHRRLSELHLESLPDFVCPTIGELVATLRSSPGLRSLKIARVNVKQGAGIGEIEPAQLDYLQSLNLVEAGASVLKHLLPLIIPGTVPVSMSASLDAHETIFAELQSFCERTNISRLYIDTRGHSWLPMLFGSLPSLNALAIRNYNLFRDVLPCSETSAVTSAGEVHLAPGPGICARLHSLSFIGCQMSWGQLEDMLTAHQSSLRSLDFWRSKLHSVPRLAAPGPQEDGSEMLSKYVPRVRFSCHIDDYPLAGWSVCDEHDGGSVPVPR